MINLIIKNVGAIKTAVVDLTKPLVLITGENNTGKTFISSILYLLHRNKVNTEHNFKIINGNNLIKINTSIDTALEIHYYKIDVLAIFEKEFDLILEALGQIIKQNLPILFGTTSDSFNEAIIQFEVNDRNSFKSLLFSQTFGGSNTGFKDLFTNVSFSKESDSFEINFRLIKPTDVKSTVLTENSILQLQNIILQSFLFCLVNSHSNGQPSSTFILPPERAAIDILLKEIRFGKGSILYDDQFHSLAYISAASNGQNFANSIPLEQSINGVPLTLRDFVNLMSMLPLRTTQKTKLEPLGKELEMILLGGQIDFDSNGVLKYRSKEGKEIELNLASSSVKSLSSLAIYLKYLAQEGGLIVIDEPEMNLHPKLQILLTRFFAKLINNGFRLIISTHSDYIIRELNALIMLGENNSLTHELVSKYNYDIKSRLKPSSISVYSISDKILHNKEVLKNGFEIDEIDEAINQQNQVVEDIYFTLN